MLEIMPNLQYLMFSTNSYLGYDYIKLFIDAINDLSENVNLFRARTVVAMNKTFGEILLSAQNSFNDCESIFLEKGIKRCLFLFLIQVNLLEIIKSQKCRRIPAGRACINIYPGFCF